MSGGLRRRLFVFLAAAALLATLLTVLVAGVLTSREQDRARRDALSRQADAAAAVLGNVAGVRVLLGRAGGLRPLPPAARRRVLARLPRPPHGDGKVMLPRRTLLWAGRPAGSGTVVVLRPAGRAPGDPGSVAASLLVAGLAAALLAAALAALLARRLTRPLEELAAGARRVAAGEPAAVAVHGDDELAALGHAFNAMGDDLRAAREAEKRFLLSVSHELKTPLTAVRGYAEALADGVVEPAAAARTIGAEAARLERLVADLLDLARVERRDFAVAREPVDLGGVVRDVAERLAPRAAEAAVALGVEVEGDARALGDHGRLIQVVTNLAENALRVVPEGGHVTLGARSAELVVADDGPGLAPEEIPRAFERFYLSERYRGERQVGSGLGLALVAELVGAMGGTVGVESAPGRGARFTVRLPPG